MAMKKVTGSKKPAMKTKTKASNTKSRGSNTQTQVGNDNQREAYNSIRDTRSAKQDGSSYATSSRSKVSSQDVKALKKWESQGKAEGMAFSPAGMAARSRKMQRAGGKVGSTSAGKSNPKANKSRGSKTAKQVGDMNQLEGYRTKNRYDDGSKVSAADIKKGFKAVKAAGKKNALGTEMGLADKIKRREEQRAGGKGK